jgi:LuxR family transcriptional regulator
MLDRLVAVMDAIYMATDRESLLKAVDDGCVSFGFNGFNLFCHKTTKLDMILDATLSNLPKSFIQDYDRLGWSDGDFLLEETLATDRATHWNAAKFQYSDIRKRSYIDFLHASALAAGVLVPLRHRPGTYSGFGVTTAAAAQPTAGATQVATIIGSAAMSKAEVLGLCPEISVDAAVATKALSVAQCEISEWIAQGKSNADIATIMGLNERAVRYHVTQILRKLDVVSRAQAASIWRASRSMRQ